MAKKYRLMRKQLVVFTDLSGKQIEMKMRRIKALRDIPYHNVKAGDLGGWVNHHYVLSQEDNAWIGGEAVVFSDWSGTLRVRDNALVTGKAVLHNGYGAFTVVDKNAIIEDNVKVFIRQSHQKAQISDNAQLSENALVENPGYTTGRIAGNANVSSSSIVLGCAEVLGDATVSSSKVMGDAKVMGKAVVSNSSTISENAVITDDATVSASEVRGTATVSGNARVEEGAVVCDSATVTGLAVVKKKAVIAGESVVKDRAVVLESARILGQSVLSGTMVTISYKDYTDYISSENNSLTAYPNRMELTGTVPPLESEASEIQGLRLKLEGLEKEINAYGNDIVKLLKFPIMTDLRDENTLDMVLALKNAKIVNPERNPQGFRESVESLERKFLKAESNARIIRATAFSEEQRKKAEKARDLFAVACNDVSSEQEKKNAFKQGFRQLEGVVDFTDSAVENMRIKVGIPELEA